MKHDRAHVRYFSDRPKRGTRSAAGGILAIRIAELSRVLLDRYGETLPADDAGRDDAFVMACHLAHIRRGDRAILGWLALRAPWMPTADADELVAAAMRLQLRWTADRLAQRIGLTYADRTRLGLRTIGSIDVTADQRREMRKAKDRDRKRDRRRDKAANATETIAAVSLNKSQPWRSEGISRSTWYARRRTVGQPASAAYSPINMLPTEVVQHHASEEEAP
ncbi:MULTISPECIES: hypothetical protein [unclassified Bradyrhizobium]